MPGSCDFSRPPGFCAFLHFRDNSALRCCTMDKTESIHRGERGLAAWLTKRKDG
nr:MAG TPA: hypothetical protein [Caudoviricetes sp.]